MYAEYLKVLPSKIGMGVFTTVNIPAGVPIIEVTGPLHTEDTLPQPLHPATLQVGHNLFYGQSGKPDDFINHSCNPNCLIHIVGARAIIYSIHKIISNTELTFDYSTTSTDTLDKWQMDCLCGAYNCRKVISGYQYLDESIKEDYKKRGLIPMFLTEKMFNKGII